jgi:hypothetical protein
MEPQGVKFFAAYTLVTLLGCAAIQFLRHTTAVPRNDAVAAFAEHEGRTGFVLRCDPDGVLELPPPELVAFTGRQNWRLRGFWWLDAIAYSDRREVIAAIRMDSQKVRFRIADSSGSYHWFDLSVLPKNRLLRRFGRKTLLMTSAQSVSAVEKPS